ncbi:MAG: glycosyltransferase family 2 protein [Clostridiales bacterium]|nr:glycosyltransferase family 2 protein [Clostridiales bacterium]
MKKSVYYTLISLLRQSRKPDRIILWLDDKWNDDNLPKRIKSLNEYGVEIKYCEDLKSYKKLIPTLDEVGEEYIITVDDDQYYPRDLVRGLVEAMDSNPHSIYAYHVHKLRFNGNKLLPYNQWELGTKDFTTGIFFPTGIGGIIYKKDLLYKDIDNKNLFMSLAPNADDIWFFFMAFLQGVHCTPIKLSRPILPVDLIYQKMHSNSSLRDSNWGEAQNDKQLSAVMNYYNISSQDIKNGLK